MNLQIVCFFCLIKYLFKWEKCSSHFPRIQGDILKCVALSSQQCKTQTYLIKCYETEKDGKSSEELFPQNVWIF